MTSDKLGMQRQDVVVALPWSAQLSLAVRASMTSPRSSTIVSGL